MLTVLHASDLQCGRPFRPEPATALVGAARALGPDVIVVSGDLTQRAKRREFRRARALIDELRGPPVVVTPGNHDVPVYRFWERAFIPYRNWKAEISSELNSVTRIPGATFVALNSSAPLRAIVGGRITGHQVAFARDGFGASPPTDVRVLVIHHHFVPTPDGKGGRPLPTARELLRSFEAMGVDLVLGGHVHQTHVTTSLSLLPEGSRPGIPLISCGTTTSSRGRGPEAGVNSFNWIRVGPGEIEVVPHRYIPAESRFEGRAPLILARPGAAGEEGAAVSEVDP